jgi:hypothetical protein
MGERGREYLACDLIPNGLGRYISKWRCPSTMYILIYMYILLRPKKNDVFRFKICPKKNDVLLNLACVHVYVGMQQSISTKYGK